MQITENIYNVGVGGNNAYLITGEKTALIDTVLKEQSDDLIKNIEKIIPIDKLDYLILNHTEQDKSGAAGAIIAKKTDIEVVATIAGLRNLKEMLCHSFSERVAKDNGVLDLGGRMTLRFFITPNINWPDSMVTYEESTKTLFSCGLFSEGEVYPYPDFAKNAADRVMSLGAKLICTGKGTCEMNIPPENTDGAGIVIIYASRYSDTEEMALTIKSALGNEKCRIINAANETDIAEIINSADALIVGTQTENRNSDRRVLRLLTDIDALKMRHKPFFAFGSYGWSGEGPQIIHNLLQSCGMKPFSKPFMSIFKMSDEKKAELIKHTQKFAEYYRQ